jgi:hypothetical protein
MYGLPNDFDPSVFIGMELIQICFSANQLTIYFNDELSITVQSSLCFERSGTNYEPKIMSIPICESDLMVAIGDQVVQAAGNTEGTLCLTFAGGHQITVFDDSESYESYQIRVRDRMIIV